MKLRGSCGARTLACRVGTRADARWPMGEEASSGDSELLISPRDFGLARKMT